MRAMRLFCLLLITAFAGPVLAQGVTLPEVGRIELENGVVIILLEKEAYSNPLLLAKVSDAIFVVHGTPLRLDGNTMFTGSIQSYNTVQSAWEPVIDATNAYLKFSYSANGDETAPAGVAVLVKTISPL